MPLWETLVLLQPPHGGQRGVPRTEDLIRKLRVVPFLLQQQPSWVCPASGFIPEQLCDCPDSISLSHSLSLSHCFFSLCLPPPRDKTSPGQPHRLQDAKYRTWGRRTGFECQLELFAEMVTTALSVHLCQSPQPLFLA